MYSAVAIPLFSNLLNIKYILLKTALLGVAGCVLTYISPKTISFRCCVSWWLL